MKSTNSKKIQKNKRIRNYGKEFSGPVVSDAIKQANLSSEASEYINLVNEDSQTFAVAPPTTSAFSKHNPIPFNTRRHCSQRSSK